MDTLLQLTEEPPSCDEYNSKRLTHDPVILYGCKIKTKYDQQRINFKHKFNPISIKTRCELGVNHYFRGIKLTPIENSFNRVIRLINKLPHADPNVVDMYKKRIELCNLTCDNNWSHLCSNVFPVDAKCAKELTLTPDIVKLSHDDILDMSNTGLPWHSHYVHFNIYILT